MSAPIPARNRGREKATAPSAARVPPSDKHHHRKNNGGTGEQRQHQGNGGTGTGSSSSSGHASYDVTRGGSQDENDGADGVQVVLATAGYDHVIRFWQAHTGHCFSQIAHPESHVNALAISSNSGNLFASAAYQLIKLYDMKCMNGPLVSYEGPIKNVNCVGFQSDSKWMYTGGEDGVTRIWDLRTRNINCSLSFSNGYYVNSICIDPKYEHLIAIGDQAGFITVCDVRYVMSSPSTPSSDLTTGNGVDAGSGGSGRIDHSMRASHYTQQQQNLLNSQSQVMCSQSKLHLDPIDGYDLSVQCIAIDPKGDRMACVTNRGTCFWFDKSENDKEFEKNSDNDTTDIPNVEVKVNEDKETDLLTSFISFAKVRNKKVEDDENSAVQKDRRKSYSDGEKSTNENSSTSPNTSTASSTNIGGGKSDTAVNGEDNTYAALKVKDGNFKAHKKYSLRCAFSPDSTVLATTGSDGCINIWNSKTWEKVSTLTTPSQKWVFDISFSIDSQYIISASSDGVARLWSIPDASIKREYVGHKKPLTCVAFRDVSAD